MSIVGLATHLVSRAQGLAAACPSASHVSRLTERIHPAVRLFVVFTCRYKLSTEHLIVSRAVATASCLRGYRAKGRRWRIIQAPSCCLAQFTYLGALIPVDDGVLKCRSLDDPAAFLKHVCVRPRQN